MLLMTADIGGTFTDCIVTGTANETEENASGDAGGDAGGGSFRRRIKVLSSGLVSCRVVEVGDCHGDDRIVELAIPSSLTRPDFWIGAHFVTPGRPRGRKANGNASDGDATGDAARGVIATWQTLPTSLDESTTRVRATVRFCSITPRGGETWTLDPGVESPVLALRLLLSIPLNQPLPPLSARLGTTRGTNALLTRTGAEVALVTTTGFANVLDIGTQDRPDLFALDIHKPTPLPRRVIEVSGRLDADGRELIAVDTSEVTDQLRRLRDENSVQSIAVCLLHSHRNDSHERIVAGIAREVGFDRVLCSSDVAPLPRLVPRTETTCLNATLQPILDDYVDRVWRQLGGPEACHLRWMTSNGNLVASPGFGGRESVLSGPAGGVVALQSIARQTQRRELVGLDMGGTSTDVTRFDGQIRRRQESKIGGIRVLAPMMDIHTIAAGGGSVCVVRDGRLFVGPESAGADPGPACYGRGGPLTITDVNVILGRMNVEKFPFPLDVAAARKALDAWHRELPPSMNLTPQELAEGWLQIAVTEMAEAVRVVTTSIGRDVRDMSLVGFGGAAGAHVCRVADALGMTHVIDHPDAGLLSAVGIESATAGRIETRLAERVLSPGGDSDWATLAAEIQHQCESQLRDDESLSPQTPLESTVQVDLRYAGTQATISVPLEPVASLAERFASAHEALFGYRRPHLPIESTVLRCESIVPDRSSLDKAPPNNSRVNPSPTDGPVMDWPVDGPAVIAGEHSVLVVEPGWRAKPDAWGNIQLHRRIPLHREMESRPETESSAESTSARVSDAVDMEIAVRRIQGIAESMGETIRRTSVSVNIKERYDFSCAVFLGDGSLIANAPHVPVHLGAMGHTVRSLMAAYPDMSPGDVYVSNDPFAGGSHLPDVTTVTPVFAHPTVDQTDAASGRRDTSRPDGWPCDFFVASRCHHAEIGGITPGSMAPAATCLAHEGVVLRNIALVSGGKMHHDELRARLAAGEFPSRSVDENMADIAAAEAAGREGAAAIANWTTEIGTDRLIALMRRLLDVAGEATTTWIQSLGDATRTFSDALDDGTPVVVTLRPDTAAGRIAIDFTGTGGVHPGGFNATRSIVTAAVLYVLRCVSPHDLPLCDGVLRKIDLIIPPGLLDPPGDDDPAKCPAVVAGNVETSNRVVDVLLGALGVAAASQGTMNNLLLGDATFGYYETIGGGAGATAIGPGADAVHTHMTNTRITDVEILESRLPVRLWAMAIRRGSGGVGRHRGGDGMIREIEFLRPLTLSLITSRRTTRPYGVDGGQPGQSGSQTLIRGEETRTLPPWISVDVTPGDRLILQTPGGGGFGSPP